MFSASGKMDSNELICSVSICFSALLHKFPSTLPLLPVCCRQPWRTPRKCSLLLASAPLGCQSSWTPGRRARSPGFPHRTPISESPGRVPVRLLHSGATLYCRGLDFSLWCSGRKWNYICVRGASPETPPGGHAWILSCSLGRVPGSC